MENKVTVIIPAFNEEENIVNVINLSKRCELVDEIIVVDNLSTDNTHKIAKEQNVTVVRCNQQGKGYAMETGLKHATNEILVFLDADISNYGNDVLMKLIYPIYEENFDFVKSTFDRVGGRVTELVAKPLLKLLFPNMHKFSQPLSGMIAGKKTFLKKINFEKDYGVDIAILLDMINLNATIKEVHIGYLKNDQKGWKSLEHMSEQVMKAILKRKDQKEDF